MLHVSESIAVDVVFELAAQVTGIVNNQVAVTAKAAGSNVIVSAESNKEKLLFVEPLMLTGITTNEDRDHLGTGSITVSFTGGMAPYTVVAAPLVGGQRQRVSPATSPLTFSSLQAGPYSVKVMDQMGMWW